MNDQVPQHSSLFKSADGPSKPYLLYSEHLPNPYLRSFVETRANNRIPLAPDHLPASQLVQRTGALYEIHSYWSKKPYLAIQQFIEHYTRPGDLVFDPFSGCGSTIQAAASLGRVGIACDLSASSAHISRNTISVIDQTEFNNEASKVIKIIEKKITSLYSCTYKGQKAIISSIIWSETAKCLKCLKYFAILVDHSTNSHDKCPYCKEVFSTRSRSVEFGPSVIAAVEIRDSWSKRQRGRIIWLNDGDELIFQESEKDLHIRAEKIRNTMLRKVPQRLIDLGGRLKTTGSTTIGQLHEDRSLCALKIILESINSTSSMVIRGKLMLAFTGVLTNCSKLYRYREGGGGGPMGAYFVPPIRRELNPLLALIEKISTISKSLSELSTWQGSDAIVSNQSSDKLDIPSNSIDYVFTDPPYADTMPFGDLNFIWDCWLGSSKENEEEAIGDFWKSQMERIFKEVYRVLKPGAYCSVCYHDTSEGTWADLLDIMAVAGFKSVFGKDVLYIETTAKAYQQTVADKVVKRDHVINFIKPDGTNKNTVRINDVEPESFNLVAKSMIKDYLTEYPGSTKDRIYDYLIARLMREERLEAHDFEELLQNVAEEIQHPVKADLFNDKEPDLFGTHIQSRWYLRETADQVDLAEQVKENRSAMNIEDFIQIHLKSHPELDGIHYSDIFEQYLPIHDKPRRLLADWLPEYFIKTPSGTWRSPDKDEAIKLSILREAGTLRRIKRFANALIDSVPIRDKDRPANDEDLLDWLRQCRRSGLYEQGRAIYERGGLNLAGLTEEQQLEAEDDYRICTRRGSEQVLGPKKKQRKSRDE